MSLPEAAEIETLPTRDLRSLVASLLAEIVRLAMVEATMALFAFYHCNGGSFAASVSRVKPLHFYCAAGGSVSVGMPARKRNKATALFRWSFGGGAIASEMRRCTLVSE